jgi:hypothetical protein
MGGWNEVREGKGMEDCVCVLMGALSLCQEQLTAHEGRPSCAEVKPASAAVTARMKVDFILVRGELLGRV